VNRIQYGAKMKVDEGDKVKRGQRLAEWDPYTRPIISEIDGVIGFEDLVEGQSMSETADESTGISKRMVMDLSGDIYVELERFYERLLADDLEYFAITREYAAGLWVFIDRLWRHRPAALDYVKGQITGPISFGLMITDERKRSIL